MILTLLLITVLAAGLVPLIQRDLRLAFARRRVRQVVVRLSIDTKQLVKAMERAGRALAKLNRALEQERDR